MDCFLLQQLAHVFTSCCPICGCAQLAHDQLSASMRVPCSLATLAGSSKKSVLLWQALAFAYDAGDLGGVQAEGGRLLALLDDMEELLASNRCERAPSALLTHVTETLFYLYCS